MKASAAIDNSAADSAAIAVAFADALDAAAEFVGATAPNPPVGCVLLDAAGAELTRAAHQGAGQLHAEALAIAQCREMGCVDRIHTVVVTLEPCNHTGRTPPCSEAILNTPAKAVWIGVRDPNPKVAGGGFGRLKAGGLDVRMIAELDHLHAAEFSKRAERLRVPFTKLMRTGLPFVTVKQALNISGSMIPPAGQKTFTSDASLDLAHRLRKRADAILTGSGTILADNPSFTVRRVPDFPGKKRDLVILDRRRRVPESYLKEARARGFDVYVEDSLNAALEGLGARGRMEVLVEAGPQLTDVVLKSGLWDEHYMIEQGAGPDGGDRVTVHERHREQGTD